MKKKSLILSVMFAAFVTVGFGQQATAKFGKGIKFMAADSSMSLKFHYRMQQLFIGEYDPNSDAWSSNFLVRRSRLKFSGHAFTPKLKYKAEMGLTGRDISTSKEDGKGSGSSRLILDAVLKYQFSKNWQVWVGQTKLPGNRERVISSANLQFVDRSLVNSKFNIDRDMGIQLHGKYSLGNMVLKPKFAFTMGEGRDITAGNQGGFNYTGRLEWLPMGEFTKKGDYFGADLKREEKPKLAIGYTYNFNDDAVRQQGQLGEFLYTSDGLGNITGQATNDLTALQADLMFKYNGISVMSEWAQTTAAEGLANTVKSSGSSKKYHTGSGFNIQAGYLLKNNLEFAGRYTTIQNDIDIFSGISNLDEYTLGVSKYFVGHALKIQTDFSMLDAEGSDATFRFRFQTEMQF